MKQTHIPFARRGLVLPLLLAMALTACSGEKPEAMLASARDYMAKNDLKAAVIQVKNALQQNPDLAEARYLLGVALLRGGDAVGAETELRKAMALKYLEEKTVPSLAQAMLMQGQFKKLIDEFAGKDLPQPAAKAELLTSLATAYIAVSNPDLAKSTLDAALLADPGHIPAQLLKVRRQAGGGDIDGAIAAIDGILAKTPTSYEAQKLKGDLLAAKNLPDEAVVAYRKAIDTKPDFLLARLAVLNILMSQVKLDDAAKELDAVKKLAPSHPSVRYFDTQLAYQKKDFKRAKELVLQLLKVAPDSPQALILAGAIELQVGTTLQAETYLTKVLTAAPQASLARRLLVAAYMRSGQLDKAIATLQPILKEAETNPAISALAGEIFLQSGDIKKAQEYFSKATRQDPKNSRNRTALALTHLAGGNESGIGELQAIADSDSSTLADMALISVSLRRGELDKALKAIDGLEKKQPGKPMAANLRGRTLLAKKDVGGARKAFEQALSIDPTFLPAIASLASLDVADKKPELARKRFEDLLVKIPNQPQALLALAELRAREGGKKEEVIELINKAVTANPTEKMPRLLLVDLHLRSKDAKLALAAAQSAVAAIPDSPEILDALGRAQLASGDTNQALITFNKVAGLQPSSPLPQMRLAEANMVAKDKSAATQSLRRALEIKPNHLDAQLGLIRLAMDAKSYSEATTVARAVQKQRPKEAVGYQFEGDIAVAQKKFDAAADAYRAGLKQGAYPDLSIKLHAVLKGNGKSAEAEKLASGWLRDNPKDPAVRMYLAQDAIASKDMAGAEKHYQSVIQIQPNNAIAYNNLAWVTGQLKKDGAVAYAEKAIALVPEQPAYMDTLAMLLMEKSDLAKALEWQTKAVGLQPDNGLFKLNLARILVKNGNKDQARKELDELEKMGDKFGGQAQVAELRKSL
jgi:putative PEP-CTERM system TPR-repeat lipoprotein